MNFSTYHFVLLYKVTRASYIRTSPKMKCQIGDTTKLSSSDTGYLNEEFIEIAVLLT